jgi:hypothetical protein
LLWKECFRHLDIILKTLLLDMRKSLQIVMEGSF